MKPLKTGLFVVTMLLITAPGLVQESHAGKKHPAVEGSVVSVSGSDVVVAVGHGKKAGQVTVKTDEHTQVKIDGRDATVTELKPGMHVTVPAHAEIAKRINARTRDKHRDGDGGDHEGHDHGKRKRKDRD
jgi:hypothetical protein